MTRREWDELAGDFLRMLVIAGIALLLALC